jgi:hypothetical protein
MSTPPFGTTSFVSGKAGKEYLEENLSHVDEDHFLAAGRPYLSKLAKNRTAYPKAEFSSSDGSTVVTIATQPHPDKIRRTLVTDVLSAVNEIDDASVVIKTHPSEDPAFYAEFAEQDNRVCLETDNLFSVLAMSDIVVTIDSNVGLEAQLLGTPCVCVNKWEPLLWNMPYVEAGPVPVFKTSEGLREYFRSLTESKRQRLAETQESYARSGYLTEQEPEKRIRELVMEAHQGKSGRDTSQE